MARPSRVRLTQDIPVADEHNLKEGQAHDVIEPPDGAHESTVWVAGHEGEPVKLWAHEWERVA